MKIYDLSMPIDPDSGEPLPPTIEYRDHDAGTPFLAKLLGVSEAEVPDGKGAATETIHSRAHSGTHLDAPFHYYPTSQGQEAKTIDQVPLEWCIGPGVVLDCTSIPPGEDIPVAHLEAELDRISHDLRPGDIVFIRTDAYRYFYQPDYNMRHAGMTRDGTLWLIEKGVRVMGIDAWAWDVPLPVQGKRFIEGGRKSPEQMWAAHRVGKSHEYLHLEQLGHLDSLPSPTGFTACVFPVKVKRGSAGWVRAVAIFDDK